MSTASVHVRATVYRSTASGKHYVGICYPADPSSLSGSLAEEGEAIVLAIDTELPADERGKASREAESNFRLEAAHRARKDGIVVDVA